MLVVFYDPLELEATATRCSLAILYEYVVLGNYFLFNSALYNTYIAMESVGSCIMVFICFTLLADGYTKSDIYVVLLKK